MSDVIPGGIQKYNIMWSKVNKIMLQLTKAKIVELNHNLDWGKQILGETIANYIPP